MNLKRNHEHFYHRQGLMFVCGMEWLDFVVGIENPCELHFETINYVKELNYVKEHT